TNDVAISRTKYRTEGLPNGITPRKLTRNDMPVLPFTHGEIAKDLMGANSNLFARVQQAPECIVIQGEIPDPPNLNYIRDCVGTIMYFLDQGAVAVLDAQQIKCYDAVEWGRDFFHVDGPNV